MKKIGIITFHASHNNGSMLQALALQTVLEKKYNCKVEIINFSNEQQQNMYSPLPKPTNWKRWIKRAIWLTNYMQIKKQYEAYNTFSNKYFCLSNNKYSNTKELINIEKEYSAFITGSDQVWNIKCIDADDAYYLSFVENKPCYAYAVSFGANNPFELKEKLDVYKSYLNKFKKISVREKNAQKWIKEAMGTLAPMYLDPTMLFDAKDWETIVQVSEKPLIDGRYIFYYCFGITEEIQKFLKWLSNKTRMPVYFMEAKEWALKTCWRNNIRLIKQYGPDVYINIVKYAELFITSSFHGTAFATIYRKNFWYIRSRDSESSSDDRATSFLNQLNLMSRYKTISELEKLDLIKTSVDYSDFDSILDKLRKESFNYLEAIVEEII